MKKLIQIYPWINNEEKKEVEKVVNSTFLTEGKKTKEFEKSLSRYCKAKFCITFNNWTAGLFSALKIYGIGQNDEVIVPDMTFVATSNAVYLTGAKVILAPISEDNFCIDLNKLDKLITKKTKAIIPVHLYGQCCDMDKLKKIANSFNHKIFIIEDAAQAIGAKFKNKNLGNYADIGGYSFYGNKIMTTGEGGAIVTNKKKIRNKLYEFKNHGRKKKGTFVHDSIGYNFMFTDLQAAIGIAQLKKLKKIIKKKEKIYKKYKEGLKNINGIQFPKIQRYCSPVHWFTNVKCLEKKKLKNYLIKKNIQTRDFFLPLHMQPCYKNNDKIIKKVNLKSTKKVFDNHLSLPSAYQISDKEINRVIKSIQSFYENRN